MVRGDLLEKKYDKLRVIFDFRVWFEVKQNIRVGSVHLFD